MYKTIFLDLDGTVLDFLQSERHAFFCAMEALDIPVTDADFARYHQINAELWAALERGETTGDTLRVRRFERLLEGRGVWDCAAVNAVYLAMLAEAGIPYAGAIELVRALQRQYTICVLTNGIRHAQESRLEKSGLAPYIDLMLTSEEAGEPKPSPAIFRLAMERLGDAETRHYLMLGDSLTADIAGATHVGIDTMWYAPEGGEITSGIRPTYTVQNYDEIAQLLFINRD